MDACQGVRRMMVTWNGKTAARTPCTHSFCAVMLAATGAGAPCRPQQAGAAGHLISGRWRVYGFNLDINILTPNSYSKFSLGKKYFCSELSWIKCCKHDQDVKRILCCIWQQKKTYLWLSFFIKEIFLSKGKTYGNLDIKWKAPTVCRDECHVTLLINCHDMTHTHFLLLSFHF